ncbi:MAG: rhodanese-like domain-containing protein [Rudanella sp.]|nr:rhodanese-like domain-containing protein [Rudanella sp.]
MRFLQTLLFLFISFVSVAQQLPKHNMVPSEAAALLKTQPGVVVLDVRTPGEFQSGHLANALNVDFRSPDFAQKLARLDKSKTYLVHCAVGGRSSRTLPKLDSLGIKRVVHLDGGLDAWQKSNLPVVK